MDLALQRVLSNSNILASFRAIGNSPLTLNRMKAQIGPLKTLYSILSKKLIIYYKIMKNDLSLGDEGVKHYYVEDKVEQEKDIDPTNTPQIGHFLKLPQK